jgi:hypothetical protein
MSPALVGTRLTVQVSQVGQYSVHLRPCIYEWNHYVLLMYMACGSYIVYLTMLFQLQRLYYA